MDAKVFEVLKLWCDELIKNQIKMGDRRLYGGIMCPCCMTIHGRCADMCEPLVLLYRQTGESKYLQAAIDVVEWSENNMRMDTGLIKNDAKSEWFGITVFSAASMFKALELGKDCLPDYIWNKWHSIVLRMAEAVYIRFSYGNFQQH